LAEPRLGARADLPLQLRAGGSIRHGYLAVAPGTARDLLL
jgi:hypothetical protein